MPLRLMLAALLGVGLFGAAIPAQGQNGGFGGRVGALGVQPVTFNKPLGHWLHQIKYGDDGHKVEALLALREFGPRARDAIPQLVMLLGSAKRDFANRVLATLECMGPAAAGPLADALRQRSTPHRDQIATTLARIRPRAPEAVPALLTALADKDDYVRLSAVEGLWYLDQPAATFAPVLCELLASHNCWLRAWAATIAGKVGVHHKESAPALARLLYDFDKYVEAVALRSLSEFGPHALVAVPKVLADFNELDENQFVVAWILNGRYINVSPVEQREKVRFLADVSAETLPALLRTASSKDPWNSKLGEQIAACYGKAALPGLLAALTDRDARVRALAAYALGHLDDGALPALRKSLDDADPAVRYCAALGLGKRSMADKVLLPIVLAGLQQYPDSAPVGLKLLDQLAASHTEAIEALVSQLSDPDNRSAAQEMLEFHGPRAKTVVGALIKLIERGEPGCRRSAIRVLKAIGLDAKAAAPALRGILDRAIPTGEDRVVLSALQSIEPDSEATIRAFAKSLRGECHYDALSALANLGPKAQVVLPELIVLLQQAPSQGVMYTLAAIGPAAAIAVPDMLRLAAAASDENLRFAALDAAARIAPTDKAIMVLVAKLVENERTWWLSVNVLRELGRAAPKELRLYLESDDVNQRLHAAMAIAMVERNCDSVLPTMKALLKHPDEKVRAELALELGSTRFGGPPALPLLDILLQDESATLRQIAMGKLSKGGAAAFPILRATLKHRDPDLRLAAADLLIHNPADRAAVQGVLRSALDDWQRRPLALEILAESGLYFPDLEPVLLKLLRDDHNRTRILAAYILGHARQPSAAVLAALAAALDDNYGNVRATAAYALSRSSKHAPKAIPILLEALTQGYRVVPDMEIKQLRAPNTADARFGLARFGLAALPGLLELLTDRTTAHPDAIRALIAEIMAQHAGGKMPAIH